MTTETASHRAASPQIPAAVFALGMTVFCLGTTEFMIAGLMPELAADLGVSLPSAGALISLFALGVIVGAPTLTLLSSRVPRKATLLVLLAVFVTGETLAALAPTYGILAFARVVTALAHGAFFGVGTIVAADLVEPERHARAIAVMFGGLTIATTAGVPLGAVIGQHSGWRGSFAAVAGLGALCLVAVAILVPRGHRMAPVPLRAEFSEFTNPQLWLALGTTVASQAALYGTYTYLAPLLTERVGFPEEAVPALLLVHGLSTLAGTWLGGRLADRALMPTLLGGLAALALVLALFTPAATSRLATVIVLCAFGGASFVINPALQARVMSQAERAPALASSTNISAFNIGNALGPWLGGLGLSAGHGYLAPSRIGITLALVSLGIAGLAAVIDHRACTNNNDAVTSAPAK